MDEQKRNTTIFAGIVIVVVILFVTIIGMIGKGAKKAIEKASAPKSLEELVEAVGVTTATPTKGQVELGNTTLYDELPEITKYPLAVEGNGDINLEIFTSGEKAGSDYEAWLIDVGNNFNKAGITTENGKTVSVSVRAVASGLGGDYLISGKYVPDMWSPSNELFGEYAISQGANITLYNKRLVGNTAGILVTKGKGYKSVKEVADAVSRGELNLGYTNPQASATGMNLLMTLLKEYGGNDLFGDAAVSGFTNFQKNIPYVAYTTMQMRDSASNGSLDGMCMEYQTYVNESNLNSTYDFIPFGIRHDNPLYVTNSSAASKGEAIKLFNDFMMSEESQTIATKYGFNKNDDYKSDMSFSGAEVYKGLEVYKKNKDTGKDIIAVFVADCSGSMDGDPMLQLKESLSNGMNYVNENNMVGLISYSHDVTIEVPINKFDLNQKAYFQGAINNMVAGGGTASYEAIVVAIDMVKKAKADNPDAKPMIFLLSDGAANGHYSLNTISEAVKGENIPIYTIGYGAEADTKELQALSNINEAASIKADSEDVIYKIKSLFNSSL